MLIGILQPSSPVIVILLFDKSLALFACGVITQFSKVSFSVMVQSLHSPVLQTCCVSGLSSRHKLSSAKTPVNLSLHVTTRV